MNLGKSEVKQAVLKDVGIKLDDNKAHCEKALEQNIGAKSALAQMAKDLEQLLVLASKDLDDGILPDLEQLTLVKLWIGRAINATANKARYMELQEVTMRGRLDQAARSLEMVEKLFLEEANRYQAVVEALEKDESDPESEPSVRAVGTAPQQSIAAQRKAEEAAAKEAEKPAKPAKKPRKAKTE